MIPVLRRKAPCGFNAKVYRPGTDWVRQSGHPRRGPVPVGVRLRPLWRDILPALRRRYQHVCAYTAFYVPLVTGAPTVDHFVAKSVAIEDAYRWRNYRFACSLVNARKGTLDDVLDPFEIQEGTFELEFLTGSISPGPRAVGSLRDAAEHTIKRLGLDLPDCRTRRISDFMECLNRHISEDYLMRRSPFVWREAKRQGLI